MADHQAATDFDVLIVGAGLSGIGAAAHLTMQCPNKSFAILEQRADMGGTWDLFRYPGIRFDTDVFTMGYRFKPWRNAKTLADGADVQAYICDTATENGIIPKIRFGHKVLSSEWSSADARWSVTTQRESDGSTVVFTANFLYMAAGYMIMTPAIVLSFPVRRTIPGSSSIRSIGRNHWIMRARRWSSSDQARLQLRWSRRWRKQRKK